MALIPMLLRRKCRAKAKVVRAPTFRPEPAPETEPEPEAEPAPAPERAPAPEMESAQPAWPVGLWKMVMILAVYTIAVLAISYPVPGALAD